MLKISAAAVVAVVLAAPVLWAYSGENYVVCNLNPNGDNFLALRTCGSSKCRMTHKLPPNTFLLSMEPYAENRWREVIILNGLQDDSYSGPSGWVYDKYICEIRY
jgi:hypothetical protein